MELVGLRGFEPPTPCTPCKCASQTALQPEKGCAIRRVKRRMSKDFLGKVKDALVSTTSRLDQLDLVALGRVDKGDFVACSSEMRPVAEDHFVLLQVLGKALQAFHGES